MGGLSALVGRIGHLGKGGQAAHGSRSDKHPFRNELLDHD
jgi:hypothetical protein